MCRGDLIQICSAFSTYTKQLRHNTRISQTTLPCTTLVWWRLLAHYASACVLFARDWRGTHHGALVVGTTMYQQTVVQYAAQTSKNIKAIRGGCYVPVYGTEYQIRMSVAGESQSRGLSRRWLEAVPRNNNTLDFEAFCEDGNGNWDIFRNFRLRVPFLHNMHAF